MQGWGNMAIHMCSALEALWLAVLTLHKSLGPVVKPYCTALSLRKDLHSATQPGPAQAAPTNCGIHHAPNLVVDRYAPDHSVTTGVPLVTNMHPADDRPQVLLLWRLVNCTIVSCGGPHKIGPRALPPPMTIPSHLCLPCIPGRSCFCQFGSF